MRNAIANGLFRLADACARLSDIIDWPFTRLPVLYVFLEWACLLMALALFAHESFVSAALAFGCALSNRRERERRIAERQTRAVLAALESAGRQFLPPSELPEKG